MVSLGIGAYLVSAVGVAYFALRWSMLMVCAVVVLGPNPSWRGTEPHAARFHGEPVIASEGDGGLLPPIYLCLKPRRRFTNRLLFQFESEGCVEALRNSNPDIPERPLVR